MTFEHIREVLRCAFAPHNHVGTDDLRRAIEEKREAGDRLLLVATSIIDRMHGPSDIHRSVVDATRRAGEFK